MGKPETQLQKSILDTLTLMYKRRLRVWRVNSGAVKMESGGFVRFGEPGAPDLQGILAPSGRFIGIEVKTAVGTVSPTQKAWHEEARSFGAKIGVARTVDEAIAIIEEALAEQAKATTKEP